MTSQQESVAKAGVTDTTASAFFRRITSSKIDSPFTAEIAGSVLLFLVLSLALIDADEVGGLPVLSLPGK